MRRKSVLRVKKSLAVIMTAAMVLSQGVVVYATDINQQEESGAETNTVYVVAEVDDNTGKKVESVTISDSSNDDTGVYARSGNEHEAGVTVEGDVTVEKEDWSVTGIDASSSGSGSKTNVEVGGMVTASRTDGKATGVSATATDKGETTVTTGNVSAEGEYTVGINVSSYDQGNDNNAQSSVSINVNGNIDTEGAEATGIRVHSADSNEKISINVDGNVKSTEEDTTLSSENLSTGMNIAASGAASVNVTGNVTTNDTGIKVEDFGSEKSDISITVGKDVEAGFTAVEVYKSEKESDLAITVEGTIKGDEHNIVIDSYSEGITTEGLSVTVWKIDTSNTKGRTAELKVESSEEPYQDYSDKAAEVINYIIKVDDTSKLTPGVSSAKEGEQVFLEVNVPSGYSIDSFYTAEGGTKVDVVKDSSGNYYLVVPRGGGVFVGVSLKANTNTNTNTNTATLDNDRSTSNDEDWKSKKDDGPKGTSAGNQNDFPGKVNVGQTVRKNGQEIDANVIVKAADDVTAKSFADSLSNFTLTGMFDFGGAVVAVPADAAIKESFTVSVEGMDGFVTTYFEIADYKPGDVIMCSYMDANGVMVVFAVTPDMINGTSLLLTIPANCTLAIAGSNA